MILAQNHPRRQSTLFQPSYSQRVSIPPSDQHWSSLQQSSSTTAAQPLYNNNDNNNNNNYSRSSTANNLFSFGADPALFDLPAPQFDSTRSQSLMQSEPSNSSWLSNGQLTPTSATRPQHRESSLSSLGSGGPPSPYNATTSNPHVVGDIYHDLHGYPQTSKPLTPAHTPSQEPFLTPQYSDYYTNSNNLGLMMSNDGFPKQVADIDLMPAPDFSHSGRPSIASVATRDSPSTPPYNEERRKNAYRNTMPKLDRTMTDIYADELYSPSFQITSAPPSRPTQSVALSPQNDVFSQRLQAANNQHLSASNIQAPMTIPSRERSPFRQGSPLAPTGNSFGAQQSHNMRFGTATQMREQQKAENDARVLREQLERTSPEQSTPKTISPKDVDLVYHDNEEDARMPLFPPLKHEPQNFHQPQSIISQETSEIDDTLSQHSYGSMATSRRESSSAYSASSQTTQQQGSNFNFAPPAVPGSVRQIPQQYPFISQSRRQPSTISNVNEDFPATLTSMESSMSEYAPDADLKKPAGASADSGTYTCTYHNCTLRFDTPAKLQRHKREGHRSSASLVGGGDEGGMTSAAHLRNSQAGPHKCERINPSTGKPCNTIFSRPYDLTRHEDTIHNARKQKVRCHLCTEEKTFSRNDALTRHFRVCHPEVEFPGKSRRRGGGHD